MPISGTALAAGVLAFFSSFAAYRLSPVYISPALSSGYNRLKPSEKREWDSRIASTLHAALITLASIYALKVSNTFDPEHLTKGGGNVMFAHSRFTEAAVGMSLGYFVHDAVVLTSNWRQMGSLAMVMHHAVAAVSLVAALSSRQGHMYTLLLLATEMTTPFINARWHLDVLGKRDSAAFMLNAVAILVSWAMGRIFLSMCMFWHMFHHQAELHTLDQPGRSLIIIVPLVLFGLNLFWFGKICRAFGKVVLDTLPRQSLAVRTPLHFIFNGPGTAAHDMIRFSVANSAESTCNADDCCRVQQSDDHKQTRTRSKLPDAKKIS